MGVRARKLHLVVALVAALIALAIAACTLNPQPLPPGVAGEDPQGDGSFGGADASSEAKPRDAGSPGAGEAGADAGNNNDSEAGSDAGDASSDGGDDASDSSTDGSSN